VVPAIRAYRPDDIGRILELWSGQGEPPGSVHRLHDILGLVNDEGTVGLVAEQPGADAVLARLIDQVGSMMADRGAHAIGSLVVPDGRLHRALRQRGYETVRDALFVRREMSKQEF
jgi:hypothetical protein